MGILFGQPAPREQKEDSHLPRVYISRPHALGHWALIYTDIKFELKYTAHNRKCFAVASRLTDRQRVNALNERNTCTDHGCSDESLSAVFEYAKKLIRNNDDYSVYSNDCQLFATNLTNFMTKKHVTRSKVNSKGTTASSNLSVGGLTFNLMQQNVQKYDQMMNDNGADRMAFYESRSFYSFAQNNDDQKVMDNHPSGAGDQLILDDKFVLQLVYFAAFGMHKTHYKYKLQMQSSQRGHSTIITMADIVPAYLIAKFNDNKEIGTDLMEFIHSQPSLKYIVDIDNDTNIKWFDFVFAMELCEKIANVVEFDEETMKDINTVLKVDAQTQEENIVSLWGNNLEGLYKMDVRFKVGVQMAYWKAVMMGGHSALTRINKINFADPFQIEYLLCCLQLKMYANHAEVMAKSGQ
eukprot:231531_1